jgi:iron-sulfur cluster assembly accessory protein
MIHMTSSAAAKLKELRGEPAPVVRLYIKGRTCCSYRYGLAFADPGDAAHRDELSTLSDADGVRLISDPQTASACEGSYVDYIETDAGAGFTVRGADGAPGCTCGGHAAG